MLITYLLKFTENLLKMRLNASKLISNPIQALDQEFDENGINISNNRVVTAEENPGKHQLGNRLMEAVRPSIASNGIP